MYLSASYVGQNIKLLEALIYPWHTYCKYVNIFWYCNKNAIIYPDWLKQQTFISHFLKAGEVQDKVLASLVSGEGLASWLTIMSFSPGRRTRQLSDCVFYKGTNFIPQGSSHMT